MVVVVASVATAAAAAAAGGGGGGGGSTILHHSHILQCVKVRRGRSASGATKETRDLPALGLHGAHFSDEQTRSEARLGLRGATWFLGTVIRSFYQAATLPSTLLESVFL